MAISKQERDFGIIFLLIAGIFFIGVFGLGKLSFAPLPTQVTASIAGHSTLISTDNSKFGAIYTSSKQDHKVSEVTYDVPSGTFNTEARLSGATIRGEFLDINVDKANRINLFSTIALHQYGSSRSSIVFYVRDSGDNSKVIGKVQADGQTKDLTSGNIKISFINGQAIFEADNAQTQFTTMDSLGENKKLGFELSSAGLESDSRANTGRFQVNAIEVINSLTSSITGTTPTGEQVQSPTAAEEIAEETVQPIVLKELVSEQGISLGVISLLIGIALLSGFLGGLLRK